MPDNEITLDMDGALITVDVEGDTAIMDLSEDMTNVASILAWYGSLWAAARENLQEREDMYRAWRAEVSEQILEDDPKLSEWKVKNSVDNSTAFAAHKKGLRNAQRLVDRLTTALEAVRVKADMLRSKGANARAELDTTSLKTRTQVPEDDGAEQMTRAERAAQVRATFANRKQRGTPDLNTTTDDQE